MTSLYSLMVYTISIIPFLNKSNNLELIFVINVGINYIYINIYITYNKFMNMPILMFFLRIKCCKYLILNNLELGVYHYGLIRFNYRYYINLLFVNVLRKHKNNHFWQYVFVFFIITAYKYTKYVLIFFHIIPFYNQTILFEKRRFFFLFGIFLICCVRKPFVYLHSETWI